MRRNVLKGIVASIGVLILILDAKTGFSGAEKGIRLCLYTVIPALFPFFVLSSLMTDALRGADSRYFRWLGRFCRIPKGTEVLMLTGLIGGYPVGAATVAQAWEQKWLSRKDAERMLGFCSNAGPSFLFGMIAPILGDLRMAWCLWAVHMASALLTGYLLPGKSIQSVKAAGKESLSLPAALEKSVRISAIVCGWIVLFRIFLAFLEKWFLHWLPTWLKILICGFLELANGCSMLAEIPDPQLRFVVCSAILAFGGFCVWMQTCSAVGALGLGLYLPGKILQTGISILLSAVVMVFWNPFPSYWQIAAICGFLLALIMGIGCHMRKKTVAFPGKMVYN